MAGPDDDGAAVGGRGQVHVQTQSWEPDAADRCVAVERPLLIGAAVAVPGLHPGAGGRVGWKVKAFAEDLQRLPGLGELLVGAVVAVPDQRLGAIGR